MQVYIQCTYIIHTIFTHKNKSLRKYINIFFSVTKHKVACKKIIEHQRNQLNIFLLSFLTRFHHALNISLVYIIYYYILLLNYTISYKIINKKKMYEHMKEKYIDETASPSETFSALSATIPFAEYSTHYSYVELFVVDRRAYYAYFTHQMKSTIHTK